MKKVNWFLIVILGVTLQFLLHFSANCTDNPRQDEVGTFSLFKITEEGKDVLYKVNTKTGQVWCYSEYVTMSGDDSGLTGKEKEDFDKFLTDARSKGKNADQGTGRKTLYLGKVHSMEELYDLRLGL